MVHIFHARLPCEYDHQPDVPSPRCMHTSVGGEKRANDAFLLSSVTFSTSGIFPSEGLGVLRETEEVNASLGLSTHTEVN